MATGGQSEEIVKRINANLECSICMKTYTDPRILDCVHSFCFKCIRTHVGNSTVIKCPLCNNESPVPEESGIEGLKSNFFIKRLINDVMDAVAKSIESVPAVCGSCDLRNMAKAHCYDCDCELCDQCIQLHSQLKVLKLHTFTLYPTDEEIRAHKEATVNREITEVQKKITDNISKLEVNISQVQVKIQAVNNEKDTTTSEVHEAYQRFLKEIDNYVQKLTTRIEEDAEETLGDLPDQLTAYETQLSTYQTLEKQPQQMLDLDLDERIKQCQELQEQIEKHKVGVSSSFRSVVSVEFVPEKTELEMESLLEQAIGFLTPIKSRQERDVSIHNKEEIFHKMKEYAVECAHVALDKYGMCQSTTETLNKMAKSINERYTQWVSRRYRYATGYNNGTWNCFVTKGNSGCYAHREKLLGMSIDGYEILLMEQSD